MTPLTATPSRGTHLVTMFTIAIATLFCCGILLLAWHDYKQLRREWPLIRAELRYLRHHRSNRRAA